MGRIHLAKAVLTRNNKKRVTSFPAFEAAQCHLVDGSYGCAEVQRGLSKYCCEHLHCHAVLNNRVA